MKIKTFVVTLFIIFVESSCHAFLFISNNSCGCSGHGWHWKNSDYCSVHQGDFVQHLFVIIIKYTVEFVMVKTNRFYDKYLFCIPYCWFCRSFCKFARIKSTKFNFRRNDIRFWFYLFLLLWKLCQEIESKE